MSINRDEFNKKFLESISIGRNRNLCRSYITDISQNNKPFIHSNTFRLTKTQEYVNMVNGFTRDGHRRLTFSSQNINITNSNIRSLESVKNLPNVLRLCPEL